MFRICKLSNVRRHITNSRHLTSLELKYNRKILKMMLTIASFELININQPDTSAACKDNVKVTIAHPSEVPYQIQAAHK